MKAFLLTREGCANMRAFLGVIVFYIAEVQDLNISYK